MKAAVFMVWVMGGCGDTVPAEAPVLLETVEPGNHLRLRRPTRSAPFHFDHTDHGDARTRGHTGVHPDH